MNFPKIRVDWPSVVLTIHFCRVLFFSVFSFFFSNSIENLIISFIPWSNEMYYEISHLSHDDLFCRYLAPVYRLALVPFGRKEKTSFANREYIYSFCCLTNENPVNSMIVKLEKESEVVVFCGSSRLLCMHTVALGVKLDKFEIHCSKFGGLEYHRSGSTRGLKGLFRAKQTTTTSTRQFFPRE